MSSRLAVLLLWSAATAACAGASSPAQPAVAAPVTVIPPGYLEHRGAQPEHPSAAYTWAEILLEVSARDVERVGARPTIISRQMAIAMTAMYDAWAAYDGKAVGTRLGGQLRRPPAERTDANKAKAMAHATFRALLDQFPLDRAYLEETMRRLGYDATDASTDVATPSGIGNVAASAVLAFRRHDGSNQLGDEPGSKGEPYSDTTGYKPRNPIDSIADPEHWQQIPFSDGKSGYYFPEFLTPHWGRVTPFALDRADRFRAAPPPKVGSEQMKREVDECIAYNGHLTPEQKALVELMRDGPRSTGQSGHWLQVAEDVSRRDHFGLDADVKLFFSVTNTAFDAFIAAWESKLAHDTARPWTLVRYYYRGKAVIGYLGPGKGVGSVPAESWHTYSPATFPTPPFPGNVSGHSAVSGACAKTLQLFTRDDRYGAYTRMRPGALTEPGTKGVSASEVILLMPTFTETANMAGKSRVMGGYHIQSDNVEGLKLGRSVATYSWPKYEAYFDGTAAAVPSPSR
ncbi:MAG TPA: vanadium-dependent haloperoxidase [Labilithrix sp.]|nr:vanadium-dependent haloperoxidase [Labilithrix sp.]